LTRPADASGVSEEEDGSSPADRFRERGEGSRLALWLLLAADRRAVTAALTAAVFLGLVAVGTAYPPATDALRSTDSVDTLFQALLGGTITGVTLVLTLNQLVLSQELGAVGDQRDRMEAAAAFRADVADAAGASVGPARPAAFLRSLVETAADAAEALRSAADGDGDAATAARELADDVVENAGPVAARLRTAQFGRFEVVPAALDFNYSWKLFAVRRIEAIHGDDLDAAATEALSDLVDALTLFGAAREHFKTLYFRWELISLSRLVLAASVPALLAAASMVAFFDAGAHPGSVAGVPVAVALVAGAATVALVPFFVLLVYVLRIATVTRRTLDVGAFVLRDTDRVERVEWDRE